MVLKGSLWRMKIVSQVTMTFATSNVADVTQSLGDFRGIPSVQVGIFSVRATMTRVAAQVSQYGHRTTSFLTGGKIKVILHNPD
jgi:hypothetical protein